MTARSFHFLPAHKPHLFDRLERLGADHYIFDLEDAVPGAEKTCARNALDAFFQARNEHGHYIRIHHVGHPEYAADVYLLQRLPGVGVVLPKFNSPEELEALHRDADLSLRAVILLIESFAAVSQIGRAFEYRLGQPYAIGLGFEDMLASVPHRTEDVAPLLRHVRTTVALACRGHGVLAVDGVSAADATEAELETDCLEGRSCGLHGKFSIHPRHIAPINRWFGSDPEQLRWAAEIARLTGLRDDQGYARVGGQIITPPKIAKARHILNTAPNYQP